MIVPYENYSSICFDINTLRVSSFYTMYSGRMKRAPRVRVCTLSAKITSEQGMILTLHLNTGNKTA